MKTFFIIRRAKTESFGSEAGVKQATDKYTVYTNQIKAWISPCMDRHTGRFYTGLTPAEEVEFETKLNKPKGTLSPLSKFWMDEESLVLKISGDSDKIYMDDDMGELRYRVAKANPKIANSAKDYNPIMHDFIIYEPEIELEVEATKVEIELEASEKFSKLSGEKVKDLAAFYSLPTIGLEDKQIKINVFKKVKESPKKFLQTLEDPHYKNKVFINKCVREDVLKKRDRGYFWPEEKVVPIAVSMNDLIEKLENKDNQDLVIRLKSELAAKTK